MRSTQLTQVPPPNDEEYTPNPPLNVGPQSNPGTPEEGYAFNPGTPEEGEDVTMETPCGGSALQLVL